MRTGQLITSFLQGKASPITTSTIFSPYVDPATVERKTGCLSESPGATLDSSRPRVKTVGGGVGRVLNDLLPYNLRPIKAKRRRTRRTFGFKHELFTFRMVWHSHHWPRIKKIIKLN